MKRIILFAFILAMALALVVPAMAAPGEPGLIEPEPKVISVTETSMAYQRTIGFLGLVPEEEHNDGNGNFFATYNSFGYLDQDLLICPLFEVEDIDDFSNIELNLDGVYNCPIEVRDAEHFTRGNGMHIFIPANYLAPGEEDVSVFSVFYEGELIGTYTLKITFMPPQPVVEPSLVEFTRLVRNDTATGTYREIQANIKGSAPDFTLATVGNTNIGANGMTNRNAVEVKIDGVNGQALYIASVNTAGVESYRVPLKETAPGSGIYGPTNLINYSYPQSLIAPTPPEYLIRIYAEDKVIGTLTVTVRTVPVFAEFTRLVRYDTTNGTYRELQGFIKGTAPNFTLATVGTTNINANGLPNRNAVEVKINGVKEQSFFISTVNTAGTESYRVPLKETATAGIYAPSNLINYSFNMSLMTTPEYKILVYAEDTVIGTLTVTVRTVPAFVEFTRLVRLYTSTMTYSEIQNGICGSTPDFTLTTAGGTNINANGLPNRNAVESKINGVNGQSLFITAVNTIGTESVRIPLREKATEPGIFEPTSLLNYSFNASLMTTPVYKILVYAEDTVIGSLTVTVVNSPTVVKFLRLVRAYTTTNPFTYAEIQNDILGAAPNFTITTVGGTTINANGMTNRNSVEVKVDGLSGQTVYIVPVNNQGTEGAKIQMKETVPGSSIYAPTSLVSYSWNSSLMFIPTYKLLIYVDGIVNPVGSLNATVNP